MRLRRQARDSVIRVGIGPLIGMRPKRQVELHAASDRLLADEAQSFEIALPLGVRKAGGGHVIACDRQQKRVSQVEIRIGNVACAVVPDAERQVESVESMRGESGKILYPQAAIVEPRFVFDGADKATRTTANDVGGL